MPKEVSGSSKSRTYLCFFYHCPLSSPTTINLFESSRLAATLLMNSLDASRKDNLMQQWIAIDDTVIKSQIKELLLTTLGSSSLEARRHTSAKVIAKVASIDIPLKQWPELVKSLLSNMSQEASPACLKQSTLETLGYVCEEISHEDLVM